MSTDPNLDPDLPEVPLINASVILERHAAAIKKKMRPFKLEIAALLQDAEAFPVSIALKVAPLQEEYDVIADWLATEDYACCIKEGVFGEPADGDAAATAAQAKRYVIIIDHKDAAGSW